MAPSNDDRLAPIVVPETLQSFEKEKHVFPADYEGHFSSLMLSKQQIRDRITELAALVQQDYKGKRPILICTLKGACPFFQHLSDALQELRQGYDVEFIRASSYAGTNSTGNVKILGELSVETLKGRHVIVMEDIVDTGTTLSKIVPFLKEQGAPASVEVVTLLDKRLTGHTKGYQARYVGFSIPDHFIIGYGLDYNELYRDLHDIFVISQAGIDFDATRLHT